MHSYHCTATAITDGQSEQPIVTMEQQSATAPEGCHHLRSRRLRSRRRCGAGAASMVVTTVVLAFSGTTTTTYHNYMQITDDGDANNNVGTLSGFPPLVSAFTTKPSSFQIPFARITHPSSSSSSSTASSSSSSPLSILLSSSSQRSYHPQHPLWVCSTTNTDTHDGVDGLDDIDGFVTTATVVRSDSSYAKRTPASSSSSSSDDDHDECPIGTEMICMDRHEFEMQVGRAMDTLRSDYPLLLTHNPGTCVCVCVSDVFCCCCCC
jgi:hypothetical protein